MIIELKIKKGSETTKKKIEVKAETIMEMIEEKYLVEIYNELNKQNYNHEAGYIISITDKD
nr:MAG TPA: hypothetical protein [Bacteriophage sp.]